jgi:hypothetical protein
MHTARNPLPGKQVIRFLLGTIVCKIVGTFPGTPPFLGKTRQNDVFINNKDIIIIENNVIIISDKYQYHQ